MPAAKVVCNCCATAQTQLLNCARRPYRRSQGRHFLLYIAGANPAESAVVTATGDRWVAHCCARQPCETLQLRSAATDTIGPTDCISKAYLLQNGTSACLISFSWAVMQPQPLQTTQQLRGSRWWLLVAQHPHVVCMQELLLLATLLQERTCTLRTIPQS